MSNIRLSEDMIGKEVRCVNKIDIHHPEQGTIGTIVAYDEHDAICNYKVQWPKGSTVGNDRWWAMNKCIELVKDDVTISQKTTDMTNEEIWEMLQPKLLKNYIFPNNVSEAVGMAYRVGYLRAIKGRPFKIGEKKKKGGHWEPVDPNNLPKEGTKIRYSRECKDYRKCESRIVIGDTGVVKFAGPNHDWFGIKPDKRRSQYYNWLSFDGNSANCLDMWVEDDHENWR